MLKSGRAAVLLLLTALVVVLVAIPSLATDEAPAGGETPAEGETVVTTDIEPAVPTTVDTSEAPLDDWTYRYLVPTGIVLAIILILSTSAQYFTNVVRKRYRIVEE